jgi:hypothetical protein
MIFLAPGFMATVMFCAGIQRRRRMFHAPAHLAALFCLIAPLYQVFLDSLAVCPGLTLYPAMLVDQRRHCTRHDTFDWPSRTDSFWFFGYTDIRPEAWYGRYILHNTLHCGKPDYA